MSEDFETTTDESGGIEFNADFSVDSEFKAEPLVPQGSYFGNVTGVTYNKEQNSIVWKIALAGNDGVMSDGETPIDGAVLIHNNWLPKPGDENEMTNNGRMTKRQSKINMLKRFADGMKLDMNTPKAIGEAIQNGDWIGLEVEVKLAISEYQGQYRNDVKSMTRV